MASEKSSPGPSESLEQLAAAKRARLAETYLSGQAVQCLLGIDADTLDAWRKERRVLAVWHAPIKAWLYPDFQFDSDGLIEQMPQLLAVYDRYYSQFWENTWSIVQWFMSYHVLLDDHRPMDVMAWDPQSVLKAAQTEFWEDPSTCL